MSRRLSTSDTILFIISHKTREKEWGETTGLTG
jgi:hypothetical protein